MGTASHALTLTARKSERLKVSKSTISANSGSISTWEKSIVSVALGVVVVLSPPASPSRQIQRFHGGEQNDFPNAVRARQHHHAPVNADAKPAGRGAYRTQSSNEVVIHHAGLVVASVPQLYLLLEASPLVDGVVEF